MEIDELQERIRKLNQMLEKPEPGLHSYKLMLQNAMDELVIRWTGSQEEIIET